VHWLHTRFGAASPGTKTLYLIVGAPNDYMVLDDDIIVGLTLYMCKFSMAITRLPNHYIFLNSLKAGSEFERHGASILRGHESLLTPTGAV
jgi:hypothetical protein